MAFSTPRTWTAGEIITAAIMNTYIRDNQRAQKGLDGTVTLADGLNIGANELTINSLETVGVDGIVNKEQMEDHTHANGDNCGTLDHGALTGRGDDDHTQYMKESVFDSDADGRVTKDAMQWTTDKLLKGAGAGADPTEIDVPAAGMWTLFETLSPSDVSSITSSALDAHDLWRIVMLVTGSTGTIGETYYYLRFNGETSNYDTRYIDNTAITISSDSNSWMIGSSYRHTDATYAFGAEMVITGKSSWGKNSVSCSNVMQVTEDHNRMLNGTSGHAATDITSLTILTSSGNFTGKIKLYYVDL